MADNDIKIYTKGTDLSSTANLSTVFEAINLHRANGNLEKAKLLGQKLATITPESEKSGLSIDFTNILPQRYLSQDIMYQIKVLLIFAAESLLQVEIPVPQLATTAINALYDSLRETSPGFFKNISDGAAFTFYYLAMKKGGNITENIGKAFSMLCSVSKNNDGCIAAGETVWNIAVDLVEKEIKNAGFADIPEIGKTK
ncbi:MAG: hypothetical protein MR567_06145 [Oscillospiraceae bacterium]|nr:hypothetical protein [Oscillospiraceae bacterium]